METAISKLKKNLSRDGETKSHPMNLCLPLNVSPIGT